MEPSPPLGLAYIAAMLEKSGHSVKIVDCLIEGFNIRKKMGNNVRIGLSEEDIIKKVQNFLPNVVGISNNFTLYDKDAIALSKLIKNKFPDVLLVLGGAHVTMEYPKIIKLPFVDVVVRGEGEYTFEELLNAVSNKEPLNNIKGIVWKKEDSSIVENELREPIGVLDELPMPAYHLLKMELYLKQKSNNFAFSKNFPIGHMITSRGCAYNCIFCSTTKNFKKFRSRSPEKVLYSIRLESRVSDVLIHYLPCPFNCAQIGIILNQTEAIGFSLIEYR